MASDINQILPIALGALVNTSQQATIAASRAHAALNTPLSNIHQVTQAIAAQSVAKVNGGKKEQSVQIPKRSEPNFGAEDDKPRQEDQSVQSKNKTLYKKGSGNLDLVA